MLAPVPELPSDLLNPVRWCLQNLTRLDAGTELQRTEGSLLPFLVNIINSIMLPPAPELPSD